MKSGLMNVGDGVETAVDEERRVAIMRNHTACHLLQAALRQVLGTHVQQAGSMVDEHRCRFDFTHFSAMTPRGNRRTEEKVNQLILGAYDVTVTEMPIAEAKKLGAMALFGEKIRRNRPCLATFPANRWSCAAVPIFPTPPASGCLKSFPNLLSPPASAGSKRPPALMCWS